MKVRRYLVILGMALLAQGALAIQARSQTLNWTFNVNYSVDGDNFSCSTAFTVPSTGGSASFPCDIASLTATVNISARTFSVGGFATLNFPGGSCTGTGGGSSGITKTATIFSTVGTISGSGTCTSTDLPGSFPFTVTGMYDASAASTVEPDGELPSVTSVTGDVTITVDGIESPLTSGTSIPEGAVVKTGADGQVETTFEDGSKIILRPAGELLLVAEPDVCGFPIDSIPSRCLKLSFGRILAVVKVLIRRRFTVRTPIVAVGVRSTEFSVEHKQVGTKGRTTVVVFSGTVDVIDNDGNITVVNAGEQVTIPTIKAMPWLQLLLLDD